MTLAVLDTLAGLGAPERDGPAADALGLLALVAGQDVEPALGRPGVRSGTAAARYLRQAIAAGVHDVYPGLAGVAAVTLIVVVTIIPRRFETRAGAAADHPGE